ncbi:XRE family transcriptional regulator [Inquilinus sp. CA228]|uniref:XRE family transcriptional regulator n=1 Tax=Inquilinus sp. CA228 TaxID=3455609 RepID=UPI003F8CFD4B
MSTIGHRVKLERERKGLSQTQLGERVGIRQQSIQLIEDGVTKRTRYVVDLAKALGVNPDWLRTGVGERTSARPDTVPLVGKVGAGAEVHMFEGDMSSEQIDEVDAPPGADEFTVAVIIEGNSMYPRYLERETIYYRRAQTSDPRNLIGREVVVRVADGRTFVKVLRRGSSPGLFNLESYNAPPMEDVAVDWAVPVRWVSRE